MYLDKDEKPSSWPPDRLAKSAGHDQNYSAWREVFFQRQLVLSDAPPLPLILWVEEVAGQSWGIGLGEDGLCLKSGGGLTTGILLCWPSA